MPLISDAKSCFVGGTEISKIYAGSQLVWPTAPEYINSNSYMWPERVGYPMEDYNMFGGPILPLPPNWDSGGTGICSSCLDSYTCRVGLGLEYPDESEWEQWLPLSYYCQPRYITAAYGITISPSTEQIFWNVWGFCDSCYGASDNRWYEVRYNGVLITSEQSLRGSATRIALPEDSVYNPCTNPDLISSNNYMWPKFAGLPISETDMYGGCILPLPEDWDSGGTGICSSCLDGYTCRVGTNPSYNAKYEEVQWQDWKPLSSYCDPDLNVINRGSEGGITISPSTKQIFWQVPNYCSRCHSGSENRYWFEVRYNGSLVTTEWGRASSSAKITLPEDSLYNPCP